MLQIRKMDPADFPFAVRLANTMSWNMTEGDFAFNLHLEPDGCLLLVKDKEPIGTATCINYGKIGWFGNLIVQEVYRKQGAGAQLVNHAITYLRSKGASTIGLYGYPHLIGFYNGLGFKPDVDFVVLKAPSVYEVAKPEGNINRIEKQQLPAVIQFDYQLFGGFRQKVLEPILQDPANLCFVATEGDQIIGYAAAKIYGNATEIGPLVCLPNKPAIAAKLLQMVLTQLDGKEAYLYIRASDVALLDLAYRAGFIEAFRIVRMFLGSIIPQDGVYVAESLERG